MANWQYTLKFNECGLWSLVRLHCLCLYENFRTISKKEFIADSAKNQSITVTKALVHQTASNSILQQTTLIESDNSKSSKKRKPRGSKYVRRSDEVDVIQIGALVMDDNIGKKYASEK